MGPKICFSDQEAPRMVGVDHVQEFLGSSTIHGLSYIASNRSFARLFRVCVVITGFTGAAFLILQSFSSWAVSPISTTIETLPITELEFPNVTVCPPRKSFTNLNPDIVRSGKISLNEGQRQALSEQVSEVVFASNMKSKLENYNGFEEKDRYRNHYHGLSKINLPTVSGSGELSKFRYKGKKEMNIDFHIKIN